MGSANLRTALGFKVGGLNFLAMGGDDEAVTIWDVRGGSGNLAASKALYQLSSGNTSIQQLAFHADSQSLIAAIFNSRCTMGGNYGTCGASDNNDESDEALEFSNAEGVGSCRRPWLRKDAAHKRGFSLGSDQRSLLRYVFAGGICTVKHG